MRWCLANQLMARWWACSGRALRAASGVPRRVCLGLAWYSMLGARVVGWEQVFAWQCRLLLIDC